MPKRLILYLLGGTVIAGAGPGAVEHIARIIAKEDARGHLWLLDVVSEHDEEEEGERHE